MERTQLMLLAADSLLVTHALFVLFVVLGLCLIVAGGFSGWNWVRHRGFRLVHLLAIAVVVAQSWLGIVCPLTTWEMNLRRAAGEAAYEGSFISHWVSEWLYYQAPDWVFVSLYTGFAALVVYSWLRFPPSSKR